MTNDKKILDHKKTIEDRSTIDNKPIIDDKPTIDNKPTINDKTTIDDKKTVDNKTTIDFKKIIDNKLSTYDKKIVDSEATIDNKKTVDGKPTIDNKKTIDDKLTKDDKKTVNDKPTIVDKLKSCDKKIIDNKQKIDDKVKKDDKISLEDKISLYDKPTIYDKLKSYDKKNGDGKLTRGEKPTIDDEKTVDDKPTIDHMLLINNEKTIDYKPTIDDEKTVDNKPIINDKPTINDKKTVDDKPTTNDKPTIDDKRTVDAKPIINDKPTIDDNVYRILIIADDKEMLGTLHSILPHAKQFMSELSTVKISKDALAELEKNQFDLILADYRTQEMTVAELLGKVKDKYPETIRMIIRGTSDVNPLKLAIKKTDDYIYIEKPLTEKKVIAVIHEEFKKKKKLETEKLEYSKEKLLNLLMTVYDDVKNLGIDISFLDSNIQIAKDALASNEIEKALTFVNLSVKIMQNLTDISYPKLSIKIDENVQLQAKKWGKLNIEICNTGNANAEDTKLFYKGEFKIKSPQTIPIIEMNETKKFSIQIFPEEKGTSPLEIDLSCKKPIDNVEYEFDGKFWVQIGDEVGKTKLKRRFGYHKGYIEMELNIINEDLRVIKDVDLELLYDESKLILSHIKPIYKIKNKNFKIGDINSRQGKNIVVYFDPISCTDTIIGGEVSFKDWEDYEDSIKFSPQKIRVLCPELSTKDSIGLTELSKSLENELKFSGSKVVNIPLGLDIDDSLKILKKLIFDYNVKLIEELINSDPRSVETWFYGTTEDKKNKFALKIRIDEDTNSIELFIASSNNAALTGLLTDIINNFSKDLQGRGIIQRPLRQLENFALKENLISNKRSLFYAQLERFEKNLEIDYAQQIKDQSKSLGERFERISRRELVQLTKNRDDNSRMQKERDNSVKFDK